MTEQSRDPERRGVSIGGLTKFPRFPRPTTDHGIASVDALIGRAEELARTTGQSLDEAAAVVVDDLERAEAALTMRTAGLVPGIAALAALSGLVVKAELPSHPIAETFASLAIVFAAVGLSFVARAVFGYAGRPVVGLSPVLDDIAFVRVRLVRKRTSATLGAVLGGASLTCVIIGILTGGHITL